MGFNVNFNNKPIIKETQAMQDGGAGNLGYFEGENEEEKNKKENNDSIFNSQEGDYFEKDGDSEDTNDFSISKIIAQIIFSVKEWFRKTFNID